MSGSSNEVEIRTLFQDEEIAIQGLLKADFIKIEAYLQHDIIIDRPDGSMFKSGEKIRIRKEKGKAELTFKGKFQGDNSVGRRKEINISFPIEQVQDYIDLLDGLGYKMLFQIVKERVVFSNEDASTIAVIDNYPIIGYMLELEGPEENITKIARRFFPNSTFKNYRLQELYQNHAQKVGIPLETLLEDFSNSDKGYDLGKIHLILQ